MIKLYNILSLSIIFLSLNNNAFSSNLVTERKIFDDTEIEKIIKNSPVYFGKVENIDFKEGTVYRKVDKPLLKDEDISKILQDSSNIPSRKKVKYLDFDKDIIRFDE